MTMWTTHVLAQAAAPPTPSVGEQLLQMLPEIYLLQVPCTELLILTRVRELIL